MNRIVKVLLSSLILAIIPILLTNCASIVSGGPQTLPIASVPDGASCEIIDRRTGDSIIKSKTPFIATLQRDSGFFKNAQYLVKISKEGYLPMEQSLESQVNGWYFGNIVFGGVLGFLIIDPATGAMWKIYDENMKMSLFPDTPEGKLSMKKYEEQKTALLNPPSSAPEVNTFNTK